MSDPVYATIEDVYLHAVPRGSLVQRGRVVARVDPSADVLEVEGHGCTSLTRVQLVADHDGVIPAGLSASIVYWALPVSDTESMLQLSLSQGGAAVDITAAGTAPFQIVIPLSTALEATLEAFSRDLDGMLPAHAVPLDAPYPALATKYVAVLTAWSVARALGLGSLSDGLEQLKDEMTKKALRWASGVPLRDARASVPSNLAIGMSGITTSRSDEVVP